MWKGVVERNSQSHPHTTSTHPFAKSGVRRASTTTTTAHGRSHGKTNPRATSERASRPPTPYDNYPPRRPDLDDVAGGLIVGARGGATFFPFDGATPGTGNPLALGEKSGIWLRPFLLIGLLRVGDIRVARRTGPARPSLENTPASPGFASHRTSYFCPFVGLWTVAGSRCLRV